MSDDTLSDNLLDVFVTEDGEFRFSLWPRRKREDWIEVRPDKSEPTGEPDKPYAVEVVRLHPIGELEAKAARALLLERDGLRDEIAFLLEFARELLVGRPFPPGEDDNRWYQLYRQYEQEEWFRKRSQR